MKIQPKREMLAKFGITLPEFSEYVNVALAGKVISQVYEQGKSFDLIVKVKDDARDEMEKIRNLMVDTNDGRKVPLNYSPHLVHRPDVVHTHQIEAEPVDMILLGPIAHGIDDQPAHHSPFGSRLVPAARRVGKRPVGLVPIVVSRYGQREIRFLGPVSVVVDPRPSPRESRCGADSGPFA